MSKDPHTLEQFFATMSCVRIFIALGAVLAVVLCCGATTVDSGGDENVVYSKIGFHLGPGGDQDNIVTFMTELDKARKLTHRCTRVDTTHLLLPPCTA